MKVRVVKALPAPMMDGFAVGRFRSGRVYSVEPLLGRYLLLAGYAETVTRSRPRRARRLKAKRPSRG